MITLAYINDYIELLRLYYTFFSFTFEVAFESLNLQMCSVTTVMHTDVILCYIVLHLLCKSKAL